VLKVLEIASKTKNCEFPPKRALELRTGVAEILLRRGLWMEAASTLAGSVLRGSPPRTAKVIQMCCAASGNWTMAIRWGADFHEEMTLGAFVSKHPAAWREALRANFANSSRILNAVVNTLSEHGQWASALHCVMRAEPILRNVDTHTLVLVSTEKCGAWECTLRYFLSEAQCDEVGAIGREAVARAMSTAGREDAARRLLRAAFTPRPAHVDAKGMHEGLIYEHSTRMDEPRPAPLHRHDRLNGWAYWNWGGRPVKPGSSDVTNPLGKQWKYFPLQRMNRSWKGSTPRLMSKRHVRYPGAKR